MIRTKNALERHEMIRVMRSAYMEIFPTSTIEGRLDTLEPDAYIAVTCSPSKGVDDTLETSTRLAHRGFKVVPHIAAKMVSDKSHLREIVAQLNDLPIDSIFVPGGDADYPAGQYQTAFELLRDLADLDHRFTQIGVASHPEGHPEVDDEILMRELEKKQDYAHYLVTQMCFDPLALDQWLAAIRHRGITLPVWLGIPGVSERTALLKTSLRIGVGDSLRFLRRKSDAAKQLMKTSIYTPDELMSGLSSLIANPVNDIAGCHVFCFNQVEKTEQWRNEAIAGLMTLETA